MRRSTALLTAAGLAIAATAGWLVLRPPAHRPPHPIETAVTAPAPAAGSAPDGPPAVASAPDTDASPDPHAAALRARRPETRRPDGGARPEREARSLLPLAQPLWSELTPTQQFVLAPFADQWNALPQPEKLAWVSVADRVPQMSAEQQAKANERIREWAALTPEQRRLARQNYRLAKQLPRDARVAQWQQYETLTDEQKQVLRSGSTSNTAARHAGARTALAKEAPKPIAPPTP